MSATTPPAPTPKTHQQFSGELNAFLKASAESGVPMEIIILELEVAKLFIFQRISFEAQRQAQAEAQRNKSSIIRPHGN